MMRFSLLFLMVTNCNILFSANYRFILWISDQSFLVYSSNIVLYRTQEDISWCTTPIMCLSALPTWKLKFMVSSTSTTVTARRGHPPCLHLIDIVIRIHLSTLNKYCQYDDTRSDDLYASNKIPSSWGLRLGIQRFWRYDRNSGGIKLYVSPNFECILWSTRAFSNDSL